MRPWSRVWRSLGALQTVGMRKPDFESVQVRTTPMCRINSQIGYNKTQFGYMGIAMRQCSGLADALFSGTKQQVLGLLFGQPERSFYATEMIGLIGRGTGAVQRELAALSQSGLVTVKAIGNQKHYQANPDSPIFAELRAIVQKTVGLVEPLRNALAPLRQQVVTAFFYGSIAKNTDTARSDIDLMLISDDISYADVFGALDAAGSVLGRPVNPTILTRQDFVERLAEHESFLTRVLEQPKIWILGTADDLPA